MFLMCCELCCSEFHAIRPWHKFCSKYCTNRSSVLSRRVEHKPISSTCQQCGKGYVKHKRHPDQMFCSKPCAAKNQRYKNLEKYKLMNRAYRMQNKEKELARTIAWRKRNIEKVRLQGRLRAHTEKGRLLSNQKCNKRRALKMNAAGSHTLADWLEILKAANGECQMCMGTGIKLTKYHIIPLSKGGTYDRGNLQTLCQPCNSSKGNRTVRPS